MTRQSPSRSELSRLTERVPVGRRAAWTLIAAALTAGSVWLNASNLDRIDFPATLWRDKDDGPAMEDRRWAMVRAALPERGVVGYVDEPATQGAVSMAWYALTPLRLETRRAADQRVVVLNLCSDEAVTQWARSLGGRVTARSGDGLGVVDRTGTVQP